MGARKASFGVTPRVGYCLKLGTVIVPYKDVDRELASKVVEMCCVQLDKVLFFYKASNNRIDYANDIN